MIALGGHGVQATEVAAAEHRRVAGLANGPADFLATVCVRRVVLLRGEAFRTLPREPSYRDRWRRAEQDALARASKVLEQLDFHFWHAVQELSRQLVPGTVFHGAAPACGMPCWPGRRGDVRYDANRGHLGHRRVLFSSAVVRHGFGPPSCAGAGRPELCV
ncbi:MAG: hypothetical protein R2751_19395 [Bacteroidales bacterium]